MPYYEVEETNDMPRSGRGRTMRSKMPRQGPSLIVDIVSDGRSEREGRHPKSSYEDICDALVEEFKSAMSSKNNEDIYMSLMALFDHMRMMEGADEDEY